MILQTRIIHMTCVCLVDEFSEIKKLSIKMAADF